VRQFFRRLVNLERKQLLDEFGNSTKNKTLSVALGGRSSKVWESRKEGMLKEKSQRWKNPKNEKEWEEL